MRCASADGGDGVDRMPPRHEVLGLELLAVGRCELQLEVGKPLHPWSGRAELLGAELSRDLSYTGLRWGEVTGLRVRDVEPDRRRVQVHENAVMVNGAIRTGTPKTHVTRSVPYPDFLDDMVRQAMRGKTSGKLLFGDGDNHLRLPNSKDGWFAGAVRRARKIDPTFEHVSPHDLRHTAASLAISAGANVKAVQRMLGHASASMTLDTYADLFDDDLDYVAGALSRAREGRVIVVPERRDELE